MKHKEEPLANSQRGNPSGQVDLYRSGDVGSETTGSLSRPGRTVAAQVEQPALRLSPMSLMQAVVDQANLETAWKNVKANRELSQGECVGMTVSSRSIEAMYTTGNCGRDLSRASDTTPSVVAV